MFKLTADGDWQKAAWYFRTKDDVEKFKYVFADHGACIRWIEEEKDHFPEMDSDDWRSLNKKPKKRAEDDLCWAFNSYMRSNPHARQRSEAMIQNVVNKVMENIGV